MFKRKETTKQPRKKPAKEDRPLSEKQQCFVREYLVDSNATAAAKRAGYRDPQIGRQLITFPHVLLAIREGRAKIREKVEVTLEFVIGGLLENFERAMQHKPVLDENGKPTGEYTYQGAVANRSLELLGKHLGMFPDRVQLQGKIDHAHLHLHAQMKEELALIPLELRIQWRDALRAAKAQKELMAKGTAPAGPPIVITDEQATRGAKK